MENSGIVTSAPYLTRPKRYAYKLTPKGAALLPVLQAICTWGRAELPERWEAPTKFMRLRPKALV